MRNSSDKTQPTPSAHSTMTDSIYINNLTIPTDLITKHRDSPLAIGLYCLIVRLYIIYKVQLTLSVNDIILYDPTLSHGAIGRGLNRLVADGYLTRIRKGNKTLYTPCWGRIRGVARPWDYDQPQFNRPRHLNTTLFDKRMLDMYLGRLIPHAHLSAEIERYSSAPVLGLKDVGAYLLTKIGRSTETAALERCGLVHDGMALPLPDKDTILAWISQQTIGDPAAPTLNEKGFRCLGIEISPPKPPAESSGRMLAYVPPEKNGLVGDLIEDRKSVV